MSEGGTRHRAREDDVLVDAQPRTVERPAASLLVGHGLQEIAAHDPEDVELAVARRPRSARWPPGRETAGERIPRPPASGPGPRCRGSARSPTSAPPWTPECPRIGMRPRWGRPGSPRASPTFTRARMVATPWACCVSPMDQTKWAFGRATSRRANSCIRERGAPLARSRASHECPRTARAASSNPVVLRPTKSRSTPPGRSSRAFRTPQRNPRSPPVSTSNQWSARRVPSNALPGSDGIQYRSSPGSRYGLTTAIEAPFFFAGMEVLRGDGLVVGDVRSEEHDQVGAEPVAVAASRGSMAEHALHGRSRGGMAEARRIVHVARSEEASRFLRGVVGLVRDPPRGQVEGDTIRIGLAKARAREIERLVPGDDPETLLARPPHHGLGQAAEIPEAARREALERSGVGEPGRVECGHRVQAQELEAHHAEVSAFDRPVREAGGAERAAVADAPRQDPPGEGELRSVLPGHPRHLAEVPGFRFAEAEGKLHRRDSRLPLPPGEGWGEGGTGAELADESGVSHPLTLPSPEGRG